MPSPINFRKNTSRFFGWTRRTLDQLCERPDHLQRLSIIGSGFVMWPTMVGFSLIVWLGYSRTPELQAQSLHFIGLALLSSMALWALVVVALSGIIKGVSVSAPGGLSVTLTTTAADPDVDPSTPRAGQDGGGRGRRGGHPSD